MRDLVEGFRKQALDAGSIGAAAGAAIGLGISRKAGPIVRLTSALIGAETGHALGRGLHGLATNPDYTGLTDGEREVLQEDADKMIDGRNRRRRNALAMGLAYGIVSGSPWGFLPVLPAATVGVYGDEAARQSQLADDFRRARRKETA